MIPCNCPACRDSADKTFYDYNKLLELKAFGIEDERCEKKPFNKLMISELIDGVFIKRDTNIKMNETKSAMKRQVKIFVSYSSRDRELLELLVKGIKEHLKTTRDIEYTIWTDKEIDLGANWRDEIDKALVNSDAAILLVSASFAASEFIQQNELAAFFKRKKDEGYLILPVLTRTYNFSEFEALAALNFFKTYNNEYGFNKPTERDKLIPFDRLGDDDKTTDKQLQDYYSKLADYIHHAVKNHFGKRDG